MAHPKMTVSAHVASCQEGRIQLPRALALQVLNVGAVAHGWVEMTDDAKAPSLTRRLAMVGSRRRVRLPRGGVAERFGRDHQTLLCLTVHDARTGCTWVLGCAMEHLWRLAAGSGPGPLTLKAAGWEFPWAAVDALDVAPREGYPMLRSTT